MKLDILAFGAHPDDVEISAGGTLLKYAAQGKKIGIIDLTQGELSTRGNVELRATESQKASDFLGLTIRENLKMKDGFFEQNESSIKSIIEKIRQYKPTMVMANSNSDRHPDHGRAGKLVEDACFYAGLEKISTKIDGKKQEVHRPDLVLHYIQDYHIEPDVLFDISTYEKKKIELIKCFSSQFYDPNSMEPNTPISGAHFFEALLGRLSTFGRSIGVNYAEGFNINRRFGVNDLFNLV